jgi:nucleoside-diphosphate-sugar epimerase
MKILIVGGCGYLGGYMTDHLLSKGHDVTVYDNLLYETRFMKNVQFIFGDIRDTGKLSEILPKYECVIWLAALVGDGACAVNPQLTHQINTETVKWLADNYHGKIVWTSTCSVYGKNDDVLNEDSPTNPLSVYAVTKLEAERYLLAKRPDSLVWRLGTLFGTGDVHSRIRVDLVANVLTIKASRGEPLTVFGGEQWRPLLHVKDVAHATAHALEKGISGLYNLSHANYRLSDMAEEISSLIPGSSVLLSDLSFEDQRNYRVDNTKFSKFGWTASLTLADGVREVSALITECRIKNTADPIYSNAAYMKQLVSF